MSQEEKNEMDINDAKLENNAKEKPSSELVVYNGTTNTSLVQSNDTVSEITNLISKVVEVKPMTTDNDFYMRCGAARYKDNQWEITFYGNDRLLEYYNDVVKELTEKERSYLIKEIGKDQKGIIIHLEIQEMKKAQQIIQKICYGLELLSYWHLTQQASFQHITRCDNCILPMTIYPKVVDIYPLLFTRDYGFSTIEEILSVCSLLICAWIEGLDVVEVIRQRKEKEKWKKDVFYRFHDLFLVPTHSQMLTDSIENTVSPDSEKVLTVSPKKNSPKSSEKELRHKLITTPKSQPIITPRSTTITRSKTNSLNRSRSNSITKSRSNTRSSKRKVESKEIVKEPIGSYLLAELVKLEMTESTYKKIKKEYLKIPRRKKKTPTKSKVLRELALDLNNSCLETKDRKRKRAKHTRNIYDEIGQPYQLVCDKKIYYKKYRKEFGITDDQDSDEAEIFPCKCKQNHQSHPNSFFIQCDTCDDWYNVLPKCISLTEKQAQRQDCWKCWECEEKDTLERCICGKFHKNSFYQQCDDCNVWYKLAEKCIGFSQEEAMDFEEWICWRCKDFSCVCGERHEKGFKMSCRLCDTRYSVLEKCVGFEEEYGKELRDWMCWDCKYPCKNRKRRKTLKEEIQDDHLTVLSRNIVKIQALYRAYRVRGRVKEEKSVIVIWRNMLILQHCAKGWSCRLRFQRVKESIAIIQSFARMILARERYMPKFQDRLKAAADGVHGVDEQRLTEQESENVSNNEDDDQCVSTEQITDMQMSNGSTHHPLEKDTVKSPDPPQESSPDDKKEKSPLKFRNSGCYLDAHTHKWRPHFTYDKKRHIGTFPSREKADAALEIVRKRLDGSDIVDDDGIHQIINAAIEEIKRMDHSPNKGAEKSGNNVTLNEHSDKSDTIISTSNYILPQLKQIDTLSYSTILSIKSHSKNSPKKLILKQLETSMTNTVLKSKNKKRQSLKHEDIYLQIGQPYQILTNKKLFYSKRQPKSSMFGCVCNENHEGKKNSFYIQCDECETWYCVTEACLGFSQEYADELDHWNCSCLEPKKSDEEVAKCALLIQAKYRGYRIRKQIREEKAILLNWNCIIKIQSLTRRYLARKRYKLLQAATITLQKNTKMYQTKRRYMKIRNATVAIQKNTKMYQERKRYKKIRRAIIILQKTWKLAK